MEPDKKNRDSQNGSRSFFSQAILEEREMGICAIGA
jgi:hypothetical protein